MRCKLPREGEALAQAYEPQVRGIYTNRCRNIYESEEQVVIDHVMITKQRYSKAPSRPWQYQGRMMESTTIGQHRPPLYEEGLGRLETGHN